MEAFRRATSAGDAFCAIDAVAIFIEDMGAMRADRCAVATLDALMREKRQLRFCLAALRIMAPTATQRASLQKHSRPDAWPVMHCKTFNID